MNAAYQKKKGVSGLRGLIRLWARKDNRRAGIAVFFTAAVAFAAILIFYIARFSFPLKHDAATMYLLDYNFYYGTRIFIGSIYTLLTDRISENVIFAANLAAYLAGVAVLFITLRSCVSSANELKNNTLIAVIPFFLLCPYSVLQFAGWVGAYDIWLCLAMLLCCLMVRNNVAKWFVPAVCVCAVFTHYAFVFSFFPAIVCAQFFMITRENSKRKAGDILSATLTFAATFVSAVWCAFYAPSTAKMSESELFAYMSGRLGSTVGNWHYITSYYFSDSANTDMLGGLMKTINSSQLLRENLLIFLPFFLFFAAVWTGCIVKSKRKTDRLKFAAFIAALIVSSAVMFFIIEANRWRAAAIVSQIALFYLCLKENDAPLKNLMASFGKKRYSALLLALASYGAYCLCIYQPHGYWFK